MARPEAASTTSPAGESNEASGLDVAMVVALISFVGTVAYARYIEREGS